MLSLSLSPRLAIAAEPLVVAAPDIPPFYEFDAAGALSGRVGGLLAAVVAEAGYRAEVRLLPVARVVAKLADGGADVSILVRRESLDVAGVLRSEAVVATDVLNAYWPAGAPPTPDVEALFGKKVVAIYGYSYGGLAQWLADDHGVDLRRIADPQAWLRFLARGRADAGLLYESVYHAARAAAPQAAPAFDRVTLGYLFGYLYVHPEAGGDGRATLAALVDAHRHLTARDDPVVARAYSGVQPPRTHSR